MPILEYRALEFETTHERQVIDDVVAKLKQIYAEEDETIILLENYICSPNQIDATLLKKDGIIVLEFKNYGGDIIFSENENWTANGVVIKGERNPSQQVRAYKYSLMNFLKANERNVLTQSREINWGHISGMVVFHQDVKFDRNTIPQSMRPWFQVTDVKHVSKAIRSVTSNELFLTADELKKIPLLLGLKAINIVGATTTSISVIVPTVNNANENQQENFEIVETPTIDVDYIVPPNYRINLVELPSVIPKAISKRKQRETQEEKIIDYYLRCLELEDIKKSELRNTPDKLLWLPPEAPNLLTDILKSIKIKKELPIFKTIKNEEIRERPKSIFFGYPIIKITKNEKVTIFPIFFCQLQYRGTEDELTLMRIPEEDYIINKSFLQLVGINSPEEIENACEEILQIVPLNEKIEYLKNNFQLRFSLQDNCIVFINEPSSFNYNLVNELTKLISPQNIKSLISSPAKFLINSDNIKEKQNTINKVLLEVFPINNAQKNSVARAFNDQITVVTGPPGTGKSQVVLNIFANAIKQGNTVLFASKNNNAIEVVNEKFSKNVIDEDLLVRIGSLKQMKIIKEKLNSLSSKILNRTLKVDESDVKKVKKEIEDVEKEIVVELANLEDLETLPPKISKLENDYNKLLQNNNDDLSAFAKEKNQLEEDIIQILKLIPYIVQDTIYFNHKRPILRRKDIENIVFQSNRLFTKEGLTLIERIVRAIAPMYYIKKLKKDISIQENNIPIELLNWLDIVNTNNSTFESLHLRSNSILRLIEWDHCIQNVYEIETKIKSIENISTSKQQKFNLNENNLKNKISDSKNRFDKLKGDEENIKVRIDKYQNNKIILTRNYINVLWKNKISCDQAGKSIETLSTYFSNTRALEASSTVFSEALKYLPLWSVTSLSAGNGIPLKSGIFDILVVDESAQCDIPSAIPLFFRCKKVIIIGDPMQLKHISSLNEDEDKQLSKDAGCEDFPHQFSSFSLYDRMEYVAKKSEKTIEFLDEHFRCQEKIIQFSNIFFYLPRTGRELIVKTPIKISNLQSTLSWVNVKGKVHFNKNIFEVKKILEILKKLVPLENNNYPLVGITTPFRNQANEIINGIPNAYKNFVTADTVHKFQGNEKDIMIFSPVISAGDTRNMKSFINFYSPQLLNVAITRARDRLIVVGDFDACFESGGLLKQLAKYMKENGEFIN